MDDCNLMVKFGDVTFYPRILVSLRLNTEDLIIVGKRWKRE